MGKIYCNVAFTSILENPTPHSTMISQILWRETAEILEEENGYLRIKMDFDQIEGWVDAKNFVKLSSPFNPEDFNPREHDQSELPEFWSLPSFSDQHLSRESIVETARKFLLVPYIFGGRSYFGTDDSGFTQLVFRQHGIHLPRTAKLQAQEGIALFFAGESNPGDLAFFEDENGEIIHVGLMISSYEIIHCFGKVRIDDLDSSGIYNQELGRHTHKLRFIRSLIN